MSSMVIITIVVISIAWSFIMSSLILKGDIPTVQRNSTQLNGEVTNNNYMYAITSCVMSAPVYGFVSPNVSIDLGEFEDIPIDGYCDTSSSQTGWSYGYLMSGDNKYKCKIDFTIDNGYITSVKVISR